jgi:hypothetical protein
MVWLFFVHPSSQDVRKFQFELLGQVKLSYFNFLVMMIALMLSQHVKGHL